MAARETQRQSAVSRKHLEFGGKRLQQHRNVEMRQSNFFGAGIESRDVEQADQQRFGGREGVLRLAQQARRGIGQLGILHG